jgi:hypothetical protein
MPPFNSVKQFLSMVLVKCQHEYYSDLRSLEVKRYHISHYFPKQCKQCQCITKISLTYLFRNSLVRITIQNTIQRVIFKHVSTDLHLLFRYFRISKFLVRASTGNTNWLPKQCCPSTRETSETTRKPILRGWLHGPSCPALPSCPG